MTTRWDLDDIPDLFGKTFLVTGVTAGLGHDTALELARHGARVVLGARNPAKLEQTIATITAEVPDASLERLIIDVSDLSSVRQAAREAERFGAIDVLVNNAGIMATPFRRTADGFESQMATNHFGPFALTGLMLPQLVESGDGRVVAVASQAHRIARSAPLGDPRELHGRYSRWHSYGQSKLANLLFTFELDRRLREKGLPVKALAAHPGYSATELIGKDSDNPARAWIMQAATGVLGQPAEYGCLPSLMAATADLPGSTYVGPDGPGQMRGRPRIVGARALAKDRETQRRMWEVSEEATGVRYP